MTYFVHIVKNGSLTFSLFVVLAHSLLSLRIKCRWWEPTTTSLSLPPTRLCSVPEAALVAMTWGVHTSTKSNSPPGQNACAIPRSQDKWILYPLCSVCWNFDHHIQLPGPGDHRQLLYCPPECNFEFVGRSAVQARPSEPSEQSFTVCSCIVYAVDCVVTLEKVLGSEA